MCFSATASVVAAGVAGSVIAYHFYRTAFVSVWCFFAAGASLVILGHFEWSHRQRLRNAAV